MIQSNDDIASRAIDLLKEIYTNLGPRLQVNQVRTDMHSNAHKLKLWLKNCFALKNFNLELTRNSFVSALIVDIPKIFGPYFSCTKCCLNESYPNNYFEVIILNIIMARDFD